MQDKKEKVIDHFLSKDILISEELIDTILKNNIQYELFDPHSDLLFLNDDNYSSFEKNIDWKEFEKFKVLEEKGKNKDTYKQFLDVIGGIEEKLIEAKPEVITEEKISEKENISKKETPESNVEIVFNYVEKAKKREVKDFVNYYRARFKQMEPMFRSRLSNGVISINKLNIKSINDKVSLIGLVNQIKETKNGHVIIELEDLTGVINVLISKNNAELITLSKELVLDEVIALDGTYGKDIIFSDNIYFADLSLIKELKKSPVEEYMAFIGDPHIGANEFLFEEFQNMLDWINGKISMVDKTFSVDNEALKVSIEEEKNMLSKLKYIMVSGDLIDGVGIYPNQEADLKIKDVRDQYEVFAKLISQVPTHIKIVISAGNHDSMRIAEPQPPIYKEYAKTLCELPNIINISNPGIVNIGKTEIFEGFNVLLYHGYSFVYYADVIEDIRSKGGLTRADLIMQLLLKKRHLAPAHGSTLYIPDEKDNLIITTVPDFFVTGHIHRLTAIPNYKGVSLLNCSTWMGETDFQEKVGLKPQVAKLPIANLRTREIRIIDFEK